MIHQFFRRQLIAKNLKWDQINIWSWLANEHISGKCYLILVLKNNLQRFSSHIKHDNVPQETLTFNNYNNKIQSAPARENMGFILDSKIDCKQHIDHKIHKCNKIIGIIDRLSITYFQKLTNIIQIFRWNFFEDYVDSVYYKPYS